MKERDASNPTPSSGDKKPRTSRPRAKKSTVLGDATYFVAGDAAVELQPGQSELLARLAWEAGAEILRDHQVQYLEDTELAAFIVYQLESLRTRQRWLAEVFDLPSAS